MAAATDDCARNGSSCSNTRVRPNYRVFYPRTLFDKTAGPEYRVDDLRARLDLTIISDDRKFIDLGDCRGIKSSAPFLYMNPLDAIREKVLMRFQITIRRADVDPISAGRHVRVENFVALQ